MPGNFGDIIAIFTNLIADILPLFIGLIVLLFFWGLVKFINGSGKGNERQMDDGKSLMTWGVIAMFVVFSFWGLSFLVRDFFSLGGGAAPPRPSLPL